MDRLRIVHVFRAPLGGLFRHVIDLASEQAGRGHRLGMFFDSGAVNETVLTSLAKIKGGLELGLVTRPIARNPRPSDLAAILGLEGFLKRIEPDVVHGHGSKGGFYARFAGLARPASGPIRAYTPHGGSFNYAPGTALHRLYMGVERVLARATDIFLFESGYIASCFDAYVGAANVRRRIVYNGLSDAEFRPVILGERPADFLYVGELRAAKGVDTLLQALAIVAKRRGAPPHATLVGSGPDREMLEATARRLGLAETVSFPGPMPIRAAFTHGRILVVPSRAESLPYVVLEAAAARVPMIATKVGGIPEIFGPFADRLCPPDDPQDLARRMLEMLEADPTGLVDDGADLSLYVAGRFSIKAMVDNVLEGYREAISARGAQRSVAMTPKSATSSPRPR